MLCLSLMSATGYADHTNGGYVGYDLVSRYVGYGGYAGYASGYEPGYDYEWYQLAGSVGSGIEHAQLYSEERPVRNTFAAMKAAFGEMSETLKYTLDEMMRMVESGYDGYAYAYDGYDSSPGSSYDSMSRSGYDSRKLSWFSKYNAMKEAVKDLSVTLFSMFELSKTLQAASHNSNVARATDERTAFESSPLLRELILPMSSSLLFR